MSPVEKDDKAPFGPLDRLQETFGSQTVSRDKRRGAVRALFDRIAPRYDLMNDLMSFGLHRLWKRAVADEAAARVARCAGPVADMAGGTGDVALLVRKQLPGRSIIVVDSSAGMLEVARRRSSGRVDILHAEAENLPFAGKSVGVVTLAFGLRNMADPFGALTEARRVLEDGGTLLLLEFSRPHAWFAPFYDFYSRFGIPALGALVAGDRSAYRYLVESIRLFPGVDDISSELARAGFAVERVRKFVFGVAALHIARPAALPQTG